MFSLAALLLEDNLLEEIRRSLGISEACKTFLEEALPLQDAYPVGALVLKLL